MSRLRIRSRGAEPPPADDSIEIGALTLSLTGGKSIPGATTLRDFAVEGDDGTYPVDYTGAYEDDEATTDTDSRGTTALFGIWLDRLVIRDTSGYSRPSSASPRMHGDGKVQPPAVSGSYALTFRSADGATDYPVSISVIPNRRDVRTIGELRAAFHDEVANLRGIDVYLQESGDYGTLALDQPQTVFRILASDGETVVSDWGTTSRDKEAGQVAEVALYGGPDSVSGTYPSDSVTTNDSARITRIIGPGACTISVPVAETGDLAISRGALTLATNTGAPWPYDHAIGTIRSAAISSGDASGHWAITAGKLPRPSSAGDTANLSGGPYTLSIDLVGTRGSATRTVTITIVADAYSISSYEDGKYIAGTISTNGKDVRGKSILIDEHGEETWLSADPDASRWRGLNNRDSIRATSDAERCVLTYADPARAPRLSALAMYGWNYVDIDGLAFTNYKERATTAATYHMRFQTDSASYGGVGGHITVKNVNIRNSLDRQCCWKGGVAVETSPDAIIEDCDFRHVTNAITTGLSASGDDLNVYRTVVRYFSANAEFVVPRANFYSEDLITFGPIYDEFNAGNHTDHWQLGSTNGGSYTNAREIRRVVLVGPTVTDSDGMVMSNPYPQGGFANDTTYASNGTVALQGTSGKLRVGLSIDLTWENAIVETFSAHGFSVMEIEGSATVRFGTCYSRTEVPPAHPRLSLFALTPALQAARYLEVASPFTPHQCVCDFELNIAPTVGALNTSNGSTSEENEATGIVEPDTFLTGGTIDWDAAFTDLKADIVAFHTPLAVATTEVGDGRWRGAYFPDGTPNDGTVYP